MKKIPSTLNTVIKLFIIFFAISTVTLTSFGNQMDPADDAIFTPSESNDPHSYQTGQIYGYTYEKTYWGTSPLPFVHVKVGNKSTLSNIDGYYCLNNLELNQTYEVKASKVFYSLEETIVELTPEEPSAEVNFVLTVKSNAVPLQDCALVHQIN